MKEQLETTRSQTPPAPAPGFAGLVVLHLQTLWREFPIAWVALGGLALVIPVMSMVYGQGAVEVSEMADLTGTILLASVLLPLLVILTMAVAFLWPEVVWRNLSPGSRLVLDAFPVSRRSHRMARIVAGFPLLLIMTVSLGVSLAILSSNPDLQAVNMLRFGLGAEGSGLAGFGVAFLSLTTAYLFASALALRLGRVFVPLLLLVLALNVVLFTLVSLRWDAGLEVMTTLANGHWSPLRALLLAHDAEVADLGPVLAWFPVMLGLCLHWAHRHDRA